MLTKRNLLIIALLAGTGATTFSMFAPAMQMRAQAAQEHSPPKSVTILGTKLPLKDSRGGGAGQQFIAEYIPKGETFDNWTMMFASRFVPGTQLDPAASAEATAHRISARKEKGDPMANAAVFKAPDGKSIVVDFLMSEGNVIEHNVFRYFQTPKGLVSLQIARRIYETKTNNQEVKDFITSIKAKRGVILNEIMRADLPVDEAAK